MYQTVKTFFQLIPTPVTVVLATLVTIALFLLAKKILIPMGQMKIAQLQEYKNTMSREVKEVREHLVTETHHKMVSILSDCYRKGYTNADDLAAFGGLMTDYLKFGGNHDSEMIKAKFDRLPFATEIKVKQSLGDDRPDEADTDTMIQLYKDRSNNIIKKKDIEKMKTALEKEVLK